MHIVLTNDDGIEGVGLWAMYRQLKKFATVSVVAPMREQSGGSHAITLHRPLRANRFLQEGTPIGWRVDGTPVDCVKLGLTHLLDAPVDLIVSGLNAGPNVGENLFYSGTVAAAVEAYIQDISGVAVSLDTRCGRDYEQAAKWCAAFVQEHFSAKETAVTLTNINLPGTWKNVKGSRVTEHSRSGFKEEFEKRQDPKGEDYYWMKGFMHIDGDPKSSDAAALDAGYISITPLQINLTDRNRLDTMKAMDCEF